MSQEYRFGGLKMIDYFEFITALKSSWIRRLMQCRTKWKNLLEAIIKEKVNSLWLKGTDFIADISNSINNIFWKEVFCSWIKIVKITADQIENIPFEHIWSNPRLKINNELSYQKSFHRVGLSLIIDLFDTDGEFLSQETLKHFNVNMNFLDYAGLRKTVLKRIELCDIKNTKLAMQPFIPSTIAVFLKNIKGCKDMYNILISKKKEPVKSISKWKDEGFNISDADWCKIFELPYKTTKESKFHWLQFKILHRLIPTNKYLKKLKLTDSNLCTFCKLEAETIEHLFVDCPYVKEIWDAVEDMLLDRYNIPITLNKTNILFGKFNTCNTYKVENLLILIIKHYIFTCKYKSKKLNTDALLNVITERFYVEKYLLLRNGEYAQYEKYWKKICDLLDNK